MLNFLKNDLLRILDITQSERDALFNHKIYSSIKNMDHLHIFMENHIFAVWDFMSILKTLQRELTCTEIPWIPKSGGTPGRLLNEIVTEDLSSKKGKSFSTSEVGDFLVKEILSNKSFI